MRHWGIGLMFLAMAVGFAPTATADSHEGQRAILVTGASSGIGRYVTERLASEGFFVPAEDEASRTINQIVRELVQLNEGQAYAYSRDELVAMLDAALSLPAEEPVAE